jgi:hypothetical protein
MKGCIVRSGAAQLFIYQGKGRVVRPGVETSRSVANDVWENRSFVARFLPLDGGKEAVLLTVCWKVLHACICIYRMRCKPLAILFHHHYQPFPLCSLITK